MPASTSASVSLLVACACLSFWAGCSDEEGAPGLLVVDMSDAGDMGEVRDGAEVQEDQKKGFEIPDIPPPPPCESGAQDLPDALGYDANCDGIDGDLAQSVFVAPYGEDTFEGSKTMPFKTISAAIAAVAANPAKSWVLVQEGKYTESLTLAQGVHLAGGYTIGWARSGNSYSKVIGGNPTVQATGIATLTYVIGFEVRPSEQVKAGETIRTVVLNQSPGVVLNRIFAFGGTAGTGRDGGRGEAGAQGRQGRDGGDGVTDSGGLCARNSRPTQGGGGTALCGGGAGGVGGIPAKGNTSGLSGARGEPSGSGAVSEEPGAGGGFRSIGDPGGGGKQGTIGAAGGGGLPYGDFIESRWMGQLGDTGGAGAYGGGGSGGGGGGGGDKSCDSYGGAGGGGGAGGCGGKGGEGGGHGGASVVIFLQGSDVKIEDCRIVIGQGGSGGRGGPGGPGGQGGEGGKGGRRKDDSGEGGVGGQGGRGGTGGPGGGGAGGPAIGIWTDVPLGTRPSRLIFIEGSAGFGGAGLGERGQGARGLHILEQVGPVTLAGGTR